MHRRCAWLCPFALFAALAPAPQDPARAPAQPQPKAPARPDNPAPDSAPPDLMALRAARVQAASKAFDMAWLYYSENRTDADMVYGWSRRKLDADREAAADKAGFVAAYEGHMERIKKLELKIRRIRQLGFGNSLDVLEVDYYRKEADVWLAEARAVK